MLAASASPAVTPSASAAPAGASTAAAAASHGNGVPVAAEVAAEPDSSIAFAVAVAEAAGLGVMRPEEIRRLLALAQLPPPGGRDSDDEGEIGLWEAYYYFQWFSAQRLLYVVTQAADARSDTTAMPDEHEHNEPSDDNVTAGGSHCCSHPCCDAA